MRAVLLEGDDLQLVLNMDGFCFDIDERAFSGFVCGIYSTDNKHLLSSISATWLPEGGQALTLGYTHVFDRHIPENFLINAESTINMRWLK